jgi:hypothetical protein
MYRTGEGERMTKRTDTVVEPLDLQALPTVNDHHAVRPLWAQHRELRDRQARLNAELVEARKVVATAEREGTEPLAQPRSIREARRQAEALQDQLDVLEDELAHCAKALEDAKAEAIEEMRPLLHRQAVEAFTAELEAAEALLVAQAARQALVQHARRLNVTLPIGSGVDRSLPWQIDALRQALTRLQG